MQNGTHDNGMAHNGSSPSGKPTRAQSRSQGSNASDRANLLALATPNLESRLSLLRSQSTNLSSTLTQRLATSQSGQNLLHIGPSLQSLPPDLHSLLRNLRPILGEVEKYESLSRDELTRLVDKGNEIRGAVKKVREAGDCAMIYGDLCRSEEEVRSKGGGGGGKSGLGGTKGDRFGAANKSKKSSFGSDFKTPSKRGSVDGSGLLSSEMEGGLDDWSDDATGGCADELDQIASLERAAHTTLHLVQELKSSTAEVATLTSMQHKEDAATDNNAGTANSSASLPNLRAALPDDTDKAQFLMKLAPRIRRLEADTVKALTTTLEDVLGQMKSRKEEEREHQQQEQEQGGSSPGETASAEAEERDLLMIGHCLRGLALLGRGKEAEGAFARVAIMPLIRSKVSMGRLDEGGARGQCTGLSSLLDDIANTIHGSFGSVLRLSEATFGAADDGPVEVDLVSAGVWAPLATALMADPGIKMALFSPGIAGILQSNYVALDSFLSELASSLLKPDAQAEGKASSSASGLPPVPSADGSVNFAPLYFRPSVSPELIVAAQGRVHRHSLTADFNKKWNLPIYYQLRFGECCTRLNKAMARVQKEGWEADVYTGDEAFAKELREKLGFELPLFLELYDSLLWLWRPDVILRPLSHRFLRGATQLVGRLVAFVKDGLEGSIRFGETPPPKAAAQKLENGPASENGEPIPESEPLPDNSYCWGERLEDVACVAWELTVLETSLTHDYVEIVAVAIAPFDACDTNNDSDLEELRSIVADALAEASQDVAPVIRQSWSDVIVNILTLKCSAPLSAVKGVAATYRMTNRPPPKVASPFVSTILRPLKEFDDTYSSRTPPQIGSRWKSAVVYTVSARYSEAVEELIATVERTENALKTRKVRRTASGGMSDGDKVKLQLFLDHQEYASNVAYLGIDVKAVPGLVKLKALTEQAVTLYAQTQGAGAAPISG